MSRESNNDDKALPAPDPDTGSDHDNAPPSLPDGIRDLLDKLPEGERDKVVHHGFFSPRGPTARRREFRAL